MAHPELLAKIATAQPNPDGLDTATAVQRYRNRESLQVLAKEAGLSVEGMRKRIKVFCLTQSDTAYYDLVTEVLAMGVADADEEFRALTQRRWDKQDELQVRVCIAHAQGHVNFSRMDFERKRPKEYGRKQEIERHDHITVVLNPECDVRPVTPYIDVTPAIIPPVSEVIDNVKEDVT